MGNQVSVFMEGLEVPGLAPTTSTPPRRSTLGTLAPPPALQGATPAEISAELQAQAVTLRAELAAAEHDLQEAELKVRGLRTQLAMAECAARMVELVRRPPPSPATPGGGPGRRPLLEVVPSPSSPEPGSGAPYRKPPRK